MIKVSFPLKAGMTGPEVRHLQNALQLFLDREIVLANEDGARRELSAELQRERVDETYGNATRQLVVLFQQERHVVISDTDNEGHVDERIADAINAILRDLNLLNDEFRAG